MRTPRFVLDNSVVMAWCFEDEEKGYAEAVLDSLGSGEEGPDKWAASRLRHLPRLGNL